MPNVMISLEQVRNMVREAVDGPPDMNRIMNAKSIVHQLMMKEPDNWLFLMWMAGILNRLGEYPIAISLLYRAAQLTGESRADIHNNIGGMYRRLNRNDRALEEFMEGLKSKPDDPDILNNMATLYVNEGDPVTGEEYIKKALLINPGKPHPHWNNSLLQLEQENFGVGFSEYVWGHVTKDRPAKQYIDRRGRSVPWWYGQHVRTLVVFGEQGVGDEVMFLSMVSDIRLFCDKLILDVHPRLENLLKRTFSCDKDITIYGTRKEWDKIPDWGVEHEMDAKASLGTCAKYMRSNIALFPGTGFIKPNIEMTEEASRLIPGDGPLVGVAWIGGVMSTRKDQRAIPLDTLEPIFRSIPDARLLSLQYTNNKDDCDRFYDKTGIRIHHFPEWTETMFNQFYDVLSPEGTFIGRYKDKDQAKISMSGVPGSKLELVAGPAFDLDRLFSMINACRAVVTVNQSNVWFGGALGKPIFTLTPAKCAWRYGSRRRDTVWFKSVMQYRQTGDDWTTAIDNLSNDLRNFIYES